MKDYFGYQNKNCVVTGAASGIGAEVTKMLVDLGAKVYALDCNPVEMNGIEAFISVDLGEKTSIDKAFQKLPDHIDSFFGVAGVSGIHTDFNQTVTIDFIANKYICENYLIDRMNEGAICFVTSTGGNGWEKESNKKEYLPFMKETSWEKLMEVLKDMDLNQLPGSLGYMFAKMAMNYYTAYLQDIFAAKHIRVNALLPGSTDTGMKEEFSKAAGGEEKLIDETGYAERLATPEEMAEPTVFLNSHMARFISGELLVVDYGCTLTRLAGLKENPNGAYTFDQIKQNFK